MKRNTRPTVRVETSMQIDRNGHCNVFVRLFGYRLYDRNPGADWGYLRPYAHVTVEAEACANTFSEALDEATVRAYKKLPEDCL